jgi:hypothetical protein
MGTSKKMLVSIILLAYNHRYGKILFVKEARRYGTAVF